MIDKRLNNNEIRNRTGKMVLAITISMIIGYFGYQNYQLNNELIKTKNEEAELRRYEEINQKYLYNLFSSGFNNKKAWFTKLSNAMIKNQMLVTDVSDHQEAQGDKYVVLLLGGGYCTGPVVYRYDTIRDTFEKAKVESKKEGCLWGGGNFSTNRTGDVSQFITRGGDAGCESKTYFSYDVDTNVAKLTSDVIFCEGDEEGTVTEY